LPERRRLKVKKKKEEKKIGTGMNGNVHGIKFLIPYEFPLILILEVAKKKK
jgi:hypothetical protein